MARQTRLVLRSADGSRLITPDQRLVGIDLTEIPNADAAAPLSLEVEQQCDLDHWHQVARQPLPNYDVQSWQDTEVAH